MKFVTIFRILSRRIRLIRHFIGAPILFVCFYPLPAMSVPLTLERAWAQAEQSNPALRTSQANLAAVRGKLTAARALLWNNPKLTMKLKKGILPQALAPAQVNRGKMFRLTQTFEIAGQQGFRRRSAEQSLAATQQEILGIRRQLHGEVERRFIRVLSLQLRIQMEEAMLKLITAGANAVIKRVAAGEDSYLNGNLAKVEAARAQNQVSLLQEKQVQERTNLATLLQLPEDRLPEVSGSLDTPPPAYRLEDLLVSSAKRPFLHAFDYREASARSKLDLERAVVYPDVTLGLATMQGSPDNSANKVTTFMASLPLPLFQHNETGIGRAMTKLTQLQIQKQAAKRDTRAQVIALWTRFESLKIRTKRLDKSVLPSLEENQHLSAISFQEGEIGLLKLLLVNRQVLDGKRDFLNARTELRLTQVALEAAAGWQPARHILNKN
ncbi:MAG: TolC family protein [Gallionella sp.]